MWEMDSFKQKVNTDDYVLKSVSLSFYHWGAIIVAFFVARDIMGGLFTVVTPEEKRNVHLKLYLNNT